MKTLTRANRVVVSVTDDNMIADFYKTHKHIASITSSDIGFKASSTTKNGIREEFRQSVIQHAGEFGIGWSPEYQTQSWNRKYWKYETDEQVEEDAIELMKYTINKVCEGCKYHAHVESIVLDSIVPMKSNASYIEDGRYLKNGNWAVAQVNLEVVCTIEGTSIDIIYPIEMRSGQLTKIKLTKSDIDGMIADSGMIENVG